MKIIWQFKPLPESDSEKASHKRLQEQLGINASLSLMLWQRGLYNFDNAKYFFRPSLDDLHDPMLMKDMDKALDRLQRARKNNEKIMIYGDYDVDGTTAVALVYGFLSKYFSHLTYYNPDRYVEGYGISKLGIDTAAELGIGLIISLDCGIKSEEQIRYGYEQHGIEFIVCDHHEVGNTLPPAVAVLDPKRPDCPYPYKELTGNGIGFKLLTGFCQRQNIAFEELLQYLDLVMVAIAADIVPIDGENRILAYHGLQKINNSPSIGLKALMETSGFSGTWTIENIVFVIAPRINAAGRIKHAKEAVKLLLSGNKQEAIAFAHEIQAYNTTRRELDNQVTQEALDMIAQDKWLAQQAKSTVLFHPEWNKGVIGIVASRCIEQYHRPTIIFTQTAPNLAAGSARSVPGFDLYTALEQCSQNLIQFGGHMYAAGMTIEIQQIPSFRKKFDEIVSENISSSALTPSITIDTWLDFDEISPKFYRIIKQMSPFGPKNMQPIFASKEVRLVSAPRILKEKHLKLDLTQGDSGTVFQAIGFNKVEKYYALLLKASTFSLAYSIEENTFRNQTSLQFFIRDIRFD